VSDYRPRHARRADPSDLPVILRGLADKIVIVPSKSSSEEK